ncbi:CBS domain-containing protein [Streptomyces oryzae]|uniref:CBS domain-containing protein n=2 Tax=Streptomyces oryzae TaxID=1434886 RepID=A0ABS3X546_9ACTN|nr:CBS domain-containing protein [Streptomyces oryzae]
MGTEHAPAAQGVSAKRAQPPTGRDATAYVSPRTVGDVMTQTVVAVGRDADFKRIVRTMREWQVSALPVLEGDGRVIGVVSEADLLPKEEWHAQDSPLRRPRTYSEELGKAAGGTAADLMTTPAVTVHPEAFVSAAARIMAEKRIKRLPVTDAAGCLRGIVSRSDVLSVFLRPDEEIAAEIRESILGPMADTLGEVRITVQEGVVTLSGDLGDSHFVPLVVRTVLSVEGVVNVHLAV